MSYIDWSTTNIGIWCRLRCSVVIFTNSIPRQMISGVAAFSWKRGKRASMPFSGCLTASDRSAWNEEHIAGVPLSVSKSLYRMSCTAVIYACSCCFSSSNEFVPNCTSFTGGWMLRFRPTGGKKVYESGRMGPLMSAPTFCGLIRRHSRSNPGFRDEGN